MGLQRFLHTTAAALASASAVNSTAPPVDGIARILTTHPRHPLVRRAFADLRTDHAGEYGAVRIYDGVLSAASLRTRLHSLRLLPLTATQRKAETAQMAQVVSFATQHRATEAKHLEAMRTLVPRGRRTLLVPMWHVAGFALGWLPCVFGGARAVFATVAHVESFVDLHYAEQIEWMRREVPPDGKDPVKAAIAELAEVLDGYRRDEVEHQHDAEQRWVGTVAGVDGGRSGKDVAPPAPGEGGPLQAAWRWIVQAGSKAAVAACRLL
ncbi:hypothetical protein HDU96_009525 [Phlyctochytrium bullatum]|nr:hypothetical protein HDU96_009525 [Phlyctochytrium bullatum]